MMGEMGATFKFDLVLVHDNNPKYHTFIGCIRNVRKCHMEVFGGGKYRPYNVDWEKTTCPEYNPKTSPKQDYNEQGEHEHNEYSIDHARSL